MTPRTTGQNIVLWVGALSISVLLALLSGIATHWPEGGSVDWRGVWLDVIQVLLSVVPIVAAGLGLPRLGREGVASLVSEIGSRRAQAVLQDNMSRYSASYRGRTSSAEVSPSEGRGRDGG